MENIAMIQEMKETASMETALVPSQDGVSKETLPTLSTAKEMLDNGMTDPTTMTVQDLAPIVIKGITRFRLFIPYIRTFIQKCEDLPRDSKHRWLTPVEGCYSLKEFFVNKCLRTPQTVYEQIRKAEEAETALAIGKATTSTRPKAKKPSPTITVSDTVSKEALEAAVKDEKDKIFNNGYEQGLVAKRILQEKKKPDDTEDHKDVRSALEIADDLLLKLCKAVDHSGKVIDKKSLKAVRRDAVAYCKLRNISFLKDDKKTSTPSQDETEGSALSADEQVVFPVEFEVATPSIVLKTDITEGDSVVA